MPFTFTATIYKTGINPCVDVPGRITAKMHPIKGYIPIKGMIGSYPFRQTLVPVKEAPYRLFVNGLMLKGAGTKLGSSISFRIEQDDQPRTVPMPSLLKQKVCSERLTRAFQALIPSRQKDILRYLGSLKSEEALVRNVNKVILQLKKKS